MGLAFAVLISAIPFQLAEGTQIVAQAATIKLNKKAISLDVGKTQKLKLNKIAARWPAKAVAQFFTFSKKGSDRIVPR